MPHLGICLGMQIAVIEFARHVVGWADAHSATSTAMTAHPVIDLMSDQVGVTAKGGTMRLGKYPAGWRRGVWPGGVRHGGYSRAPPAPVRVQQPLPLRNGGGRAAAVGPVPGWQPGGDRGGARPPLVRGGRSSTSGKLKSRPDRPHPLSSGALQAFGDGGIRRSPKSGRSEVTSCRLDCR